MQAKLIVVEPLSQIMEYRVTLPLTIGRGREANLQLPHALVSRLHCELVEERGRIVVRDLSSLNGTFVAGQRVESALLLPGQLLTIGSVTLRAIYGNEVIVAPGGDMQDVPEAIDTVSIEDTAQASVKADLPEESEALEFRDDSRSDFMRPSDN